MALLILRWLFIALLCVGIVAATFNPMVRKTVASLLQKYWKPIVATVGLFALVLLISLNGT